MSAAKKLTTGLTGLAVQSKPNDMLKLLYNKTLMHLTKYPQDSKYKVATEHIVKKKLNYVKSEPDREKLERLLGVQLEEAIIDAQREVVLSRTLKEYQPWQSLMGDAPPSQYDWPPISKFHQK
ncbi:NADH dehydrogenase [ubiquinone] 1 alpha subcomplex subunit 5-like [Symsagittifera roscoffensis]|uniref:NADH dehydrogenase [ubiquinone] 1 alpha subcomplex subunit 5-like n=1 Tax=Symsagittifera roscoffensis TaxID=84072 RepID=UPI00307BABCC